MASLNFPPVRTYSDEPVRRSGRVPAGGRAVAGRAGLRRTWLSPSARPQDNLVYDGMWRAEVRGHGFVNGHRGGQGIWARAGRSGSVPFLPGPAHRAAVLLVRYRAAAGRPGALQRKAGAASGEISLELPEAQISAWWNSGWALCRRASIPALVSLGGGAQWNWMVLCWCRRPGRRRWLSAGGTGSPIPQILAGA